MNLLQSDLSVVGLRGGALYRTVKQQLFCSLTRHWASLETLYQIGVSR